MSLESVSSNYYGYEAILGGNAAGRAIKEDPLGRDAFLTMLVAQLKNQDPLNPMQGTDFSSQLAQFSSLEQLFNVNDNLEALQGSFDKGDEENLLDFIGREVSVMDSSLALENGTCVGGSYELDVDASVLINIFDSTGTKIAQLTPGLQRAGIHEVQWNGKGDAGEIFPSGTYQYEVLGLDKSGLYTKLDTGFNGKITGVTFEKGTPYLLMGDRLVAPASVTRVWEEA